MPDLQQKLEELKKEYSKTKYNKATNKHLGILRRKIANIKKELASKKGQKGAGFAVKKTGDATVVLVGFPNAGKSSLLNLLTSAESRIAGYAFTTLDVIPGMLEYKGAKIQVLDVPGLIEGAHLGKGGGAKIASVIRVADLILFVIDINYPAQLYQLIDELYALDIIANGKRPSIRIEKKSTGGISIEENRHKVPKKAEITKVLSEFKIYNADVVFFEDSSIENVAEALDDNISYIASVALLNKMDTVDAEYIIAVKKELESTVGMGIIPVSASEGINADLLKERIFKSLGLMRIYLKPKEGNADLQKPLMLREGSRVIDAAKAIHSRLAKNTRYAYISGSSAKFSNQKVGKEHILHDGDIITIAYEKS